MLPGLRDTSWPTRFAIFAALVGHAFAPRPIEGQPRSLAAARARPARPLPPATLPPPIQVRMVRTPVIREITSSREAARAPRPVGWIEPVGRAALPWSLPEDPGERAVFPRFAWRLEGRTFLGLQLGRVRTVRDAPSRDEVPRGFGLRAVLSF